MKMKQKYYVFENSGLSAYNTKEEADKAVNSCIRDGISSDIITVVKGVELFIKALIVDDEDDESIKLKET